MKSKSFFFLVLISFWVGGDHLLCADPVDGLIKTIQAPSSEWELKRKINKDQSELKLAVKGKEPVVNIGVRIFKNVPISSNTYLEEVRKHMISDPRYKEGNVDEIHNKERFGKEWAFLTLVMGPEIHQELWVRKLASDVVMMVLYTAVGSYYEQYHSDFDGILQQSALP